MGGILEGSIGRRGSLIPLKEEIDYIENYIGLMKLKYHDKLSLRIDVSDQCLNQEVVRIMLQPVIENSLIHGIEKMDKPGLIEIKAAYDEERFVLSVSDNGPGISPDRLEELDRWLASGPEGPLPERIGLKNVHDRIQMQYGNAYGISISSNPDSGTTITFVLPARNAERRMNDDV